MRTVEASTLPVGRPMLFFHGESGAGKTITALGIECLKLVIDGENGTKPYRSHPKLGKLFRVPVDGNGQPINTDSPIELERMIDELLADPGDFTLLVVDPITVFYQRMLDIADDVMRNKAREKRGGVTDYDAVMNPSARGRINMNMRRIMAKLRRLDMAVIVTARERNLYEAVGDSGELKMRGTTFASTTDAPYEFDAVFKLQRYGDKLTALPEKLRGGDTTREIDGFGADWLMNYYGRDAWTRRAVARPVLSTEQEMEINGLIQNLGISPNNVQSSLARRGANTIADLSPAQADEMLAQLRARRDQLLQIVTAPAPTDTPPPVPPAPTGVALSSPPVAAEPTTHAPAERTAKPSTDAAPAAAQS